MSFSASDAAFEGFRLTRRSPMTVLWWALAYIVFFAGVMALASGSIIQMVNEMERLEGMSNPQFSDFNTLGLIYFSLFAWVMPLSLVFGAVINAAVARAVLRPAQSAFGYLRLGMDEVRVLVVTLVLGLVFGVIMTLGGSVIGFVAGFANASGTSGLWLGVILGGIALMLLAIWLMVRFSLAVPIVVAERRFAFLDSFARTRGRFWPILGMAVLAVVMSLLVGLLGGIIAQAVTLMTGGLNVLSGMEEARLDEIIRTAWPALLGWGVINALISSLQLAVIYAPFSAAYRALSGKDGEAA
ncbi:MAG: hypothetical protein J0M36_03125 [Caulobacterales bacterium]|nr:hypothetical protein [Caulobacterales bacterium]